MALRLKTRLGVSPAGRGRIWLSFHRNELEFVERTFIDELHVMSDCAVYYDDFAPEIPSADLPDSVHPSDASGSDQPTDASCSDQPTDTPGSIQPIDFPTNMQLIIVLITENYLESSSDRLEVMLVEAKELNIPVLPVLLEELSIEKFESIFGQRHYLPYSSGAEEGSSYREKMTEMLNVYIVKDDLRMKIIRSFRKKIFLSYRKIDRPQANALMRMIHAREDNYDVAIWYDENLIAGEEFNKAIMDELVSCDLFLLLVTPHVLQNAENGEPNYVMRIELPAAKEHAREILAVEMLRTEDGWKEQLGLSDPICVSSGDACDSCTDKLGTHEIKDMSSETKYLLGFAYLDGILVERDPQRGIGLVETAAQEGYIQAIRELKERYFHGNGVPMDMQASYLWLNRLIRQLEPEKAIFELEISVQRFLDAGENQLACRCAIKMEELASRMSADTKDERIAAYWAVIQARAFSYLGDAYMREDYMEEALKYVRKSCSVLEPRMAYYRSKTDQIMKIMENMPAIIAREAVSVIREPAELVKATLSVNYDHLIDYLTRLGQIEEANLVLEKKQALFEEQNAASEQVLFAEEDTEEACSGNPGDLFFTYVRKAEIDEKKNDLDQAAVWMEQAIRVFEEGWKDSTDWEKKLEKATALNKLAFYYIFGSNPSAETLRKINSCIMEAFDICEAIVDIDPNNVPALRERTICLERMGCFAMLRGKASIMPQSFRLCEEERERIAELFPSTIAQQDLSNIREMIRMYYADLWKRTYEQLADKHPHSNDASSIDLPFSMILQEERIQESVNGGGLYLIGSFRLTKERVRDIFGGTCAVLSPAESTLPLIEGTIPRPTVPVKEVLHMFRLTFLGEGSNVCLTDLGAEILLGEGIDKPEHTMILYHIVDSEYQNYLVLLFSLAVLETKIAELCAADIFKPSACLRDNGHFRADTDILKAMVINLVYEYFDKYLLPDSIYANTPIHSVDPCRMVITNEFVGNEIDDSGGNGYYMFAVLVR